MDTSFFEMYFEFRALTDVLLILIFSLISIPIVRWAYNWNRDFGWYYPLVFFYLITPIIILLIKRKGNPDKVKLKAISLSKFIINYTWVNVGLILSNSFAEILDFKIEIGIFPVYELNIGLALYLISYCIVYSIIRSKFTTQISTNDAISD